MEKDSEDKYPSRPKSHIIGDRALSVFNYRRKNEWVCQESRRDYGWDIIVTIVVDEHVREDFLVQLKGHESPYYISGEKFISEQFKVSTVRWLIEKPNPVLICICHVNSPTEPIYFVWLQDALDEICKANSSWEKQEYITLRIPLDNDFTKDSCEKIEEEVRNFYTDLRIKKNIGDILAPSLPSETLKSYRDKSHSYAIENIAPTLKDAGIIDIFDEKIETLSKPEQELSRTLSEISAFLRTLNDREAHKILKTLEGKVEGVSDGIKARYFNSKGVLALHLKNDEEAIEWFKKAYELRPKEPKIATNYLLTQFHLFINKKESQLPKDFPSKLDEVVSTNLEFWPAIRLKAYFLAETSSIEDAHNFLEGSYALEKDPLPTHVCLSELYKNVGRFDDAIETLKQIENKGIGLDENYYSLHGFLLFAKAIGGISTPDNITIYGAGPASLNIELLKGALDYYEKAYKEIVSKGFPVIYEDSLVNYATVLGLLEEHKKSEAIARAYLDIHPDSIQLNCSLSASLFKQGKYHQSIKYGLIAYAGEPSSTVFINLILTLYAAEEYDKVLKTASERQDAGYHNKREEGIARTFAALSYKELGLMDKAEEQISIMENDEELIIDSVIAKASIIDENEKAANIYRSGLSKYPNDLRLLGFLLAELIPVSEETSREIIDLSQNIKQMRQLIPKEYYELGRAYLFINKPEDAEKIIREGLSRYPHEYRLIFEHASILYRLGYEDESYYELNLYLNEGKRDYAVLKNMATAAKDAGRVNDAVNLLSSALKKTEDESERGMIHCQLYDLKRRMEYPPKELLRHIVEYGKTTKLDPELESRYLMLFMISPDILDFEKDDEVNIWAKDFRQRLQAFTEKYPKFPQLRKFTIPEGVSDEEKAKEFLATIAYISLPHSLATASAKIATRSGEWPLSFRARYLYLMSIYDYWGLCTKSKETQHAIHIWRQFNNLDEEISVAGKSRIVCIDLSALLTLAEFDILDTLNIYKQIYIAWGTKSSLESEMFSLKSPNPLAQKIYKWRIEKRSKIRVRGDIEEADEASHITGYQMTTGGIFLKKDDSITRTFGDGIGETLLLAHKLKLPLFSDESFFRTIAKNNYEIKTFSTLGLLNHLVDKRLLSLSDVTRLYSQMIEKNFMVIPFTAAHLHGRLKEMLSTARSSGKDYLKSTELRADPILMSFLKQFGEQTLYQQMTHIAIEWWLLLINDSDIPNEQSVECICYVCFILSMRVISTVTGGIHGTEQQERMASVLSYFLWRAYSMDKSLTAKAWSVIKSCCEIYFEGKSENILFKLLPEWFKRILEKNNALTDDDKRVALFEIPEYFSHYEKDKFSIYFIRNKPKFMK